MGETKLTREQIFAAESYTNLSTLIGHALTASVFELNHPEHKQPGDQKVWSANQIPAILSNDNINTELSESALVDQLSCLFDPRIKEIVGPSSLYDMFHLATSCFSYDFTSPEEEPSPLDMRKMAFAWMIVKRVFAVNHYEEAWHILNLPDVIAGNIVYSSAPLALPIDEKDRSFIVEACDLCAADIATKTPLQQLVDEAVRVLEKEKKASQSMILPPIGSIPNGEPLNFLYRVISGKSGRKTNQSKNNRHEQITWLQGKENKDSVRVIREVKQKDSTIFVEISQAEKYLSKTSKTFSKTLLFTLQKMNDQNFPLEVGFPLQELVDLGMYSTTSNAARAIKEFFAQQKQITLGGTVKKGKKTIKEEGGVLFYHYRIENGFVKLSVNENFNMGFIANYFTVFPRFAYALSNNAFTLVRYIFYLARQNTSKIKDKGAFTIGLDDIRENLGLPSPEEVKNSRYKQLIIEPIEEAIDGIEEALQTVPEAKDYGFTITPVGTDTNNINQWLSGYLEIGLKGDFAETFINLATKAEADRTKWERIKTAELAKLAAKKEAEEAKKQNGSN